MAGWGFTLCGPAPATSVMLAARAAGRVRRDRIVSLCPEAIS
jgi:hypothetical protein